MMADQIVHKREGGNMKKDRGQEIDPIRRKNAEK